MSERRKTQEFSILAHVPFRWFVAVLCITSLLLSILAWFSWQSYREWQTTATKVVRLQELIGTITTSDEVLTMSARMAAMTGDLKWEERYLRFEPSLDKAIKEARQTLPDQVVGDAFSKTDEANMALVAMEKRSFDLVRQHQMEQAEQLLFSDLYQQQKIIYSDGIAEALAFVDAYIENTLITQQRQAFFSFVAAVAVFVMSLAAWILVLRLTSSYLNERNRMETELRQSQMFLDSIIENLPLMVFIKDAETLSFVRFNKTGEDLIGYTRHDLLGKNDYDFFPKEQADFYIQKDREVLSQLRCVDIPEEPVQTRLHGKRILHTKKIPLLDKEGKAEYLLGISEDITERKKAEEELKTLEKERIKAQKIESIGTLAGGIAHDFNNLLQGVFGYISLAKLEVDDREKCTGMLEEAEKALHMTVQLTNQLLTFSKGGKPLKKTIRLLPVIENAVKFALSGSRLNPMIEVDRNLWNVTVDGDQISQVIQNIVLNADQAMPEGGRVEIGAQNVQVPGSDVPIELAAGKYVEISVTDTGEGIAEDNLERIFEPYFTTKEQGSGLGLATSFSIINNHNGTITVRSGQGRGTTFRIYLPASSKTHQAEKKNVTSEAFQSKVRVLVMDDDDVVLSLAREFLITLGHDVETAGNGEEAISLFRKAQESGEDFDVVILDLTVRGGLGGLDTIKKLVELDDTVKAIVSSGYSDNAAIATHKMQGFRAVLKKPYTIDELREALKLVVRSE